MVMLRHGQSHVTGSVTAIDDQGNAEISSNLASKPLWVKGEALDQIQFGSKQFVWDVPASWIKLTNGDILPVLIESLDEKQLTVLSPHAGRLVIPREAVGTINMGNQSSKLIYQGPGRREDWADKDDGQMGWRFEKQGMIANGSATASRNLNLPSQFALRFTLVWQGGGLLNFKIYFADPLTSKTTQEPADRYFLQFVSAGLEIVRESSKRKRFHTLIKLDRSAMQMKDTSLVTEIRCNRDTGLMEILLNKVSVAQFIDPISGYPSGGGMTVVTENLDGIAQEIRDIEVYGKEDHDLSDLILAGGKDEFAILTSRENDQWLGTLGAIRPLNEESTFFFTISKQQLLMELPAKDVSMVFLANRMAPMPAAKNPYILRLYHGGSLAVSSCRFSEGRFYASHPLLGSIILRPGSVCSIERVSTEDVNE